MADATTVAVDPTADPTVDPNAIDPNAPPPDPYADPSFPNLDQMQYYDGAYSTSADGIIDPNAPNPWGPDGAGVPGMGGYGSGWGLGNQPNYGLGGAIWGQPSWFDWSQAGRTEDPTAGDLQMWYTLNGNQYTMPLGGMYGDTSDFQPPPDYTDPNAGLTATS